MGLVVTPPMPIRVLLHDDRAAIIGGDCLVFLRTLKASSIDSVVTDPPAGVGFMGKGWDSDKGGRDAWVAWLAEIMRECLRVLKPGGHALVWALPRTSHWTATAIEDAGFEIRDVVMHLFGTGFPKSLNVGDGRGTALKPAAEHWILARKPLDGTVAGNVQAWGTGALNIDVSRLGEKPRKTGTIDPDASAGSGVTLTGSNGARQIAFDARDQGRWPAHVVLSHLDECEAIGVESARRNVPITVPAGPRDDGSGWSTGIRSASAVDVSQTAYRCAPGCAVAALDEQSGYSKSPGKVTRGARRGITDNGKFTMGRQENVSCPSDAGGASRFFYCAKPSKAETEAGLEHLPVRTAGELTDRDDDTDGLKSPRAGAGRGGGRRNHHPTKKSIALMRYLIRLITPPGGLVLDPFAGSGTTLIAAVAEGARAIGCELTEDYWPIIVGRVRHALGTATISSAGSHVGT